MGKKTKTKDEPGTVLGRTVEKHPDNPDDRLASGLSLLLEGRAREAADALTEANKRDPDAVDIRYYLAPAI